MSQENLFVFGTLMEPRLLSLVLGRPINSKDLIPGFAQNCRRITTKTGNYLFLVTRHQIDSKMPGLLLLNVADDELKRLDIWEDDLYVRTEFSVLTKDGDKKIAWLYTDPKGKTIPYSDGEWSLEDFRDSGYLKKHLELASRPVNEWNQWSMANAN